MKIMKLLAFLCLIGNLSTPQQASALQPHCLAEWNRPSDWITTRTVVFRQGPYHIIDEATQISDLQEGYNCGGGYAIGKVKIQTQLPLEQLSLGFPSSAFECRVEFDQYTPSLPDFNAVREALSSPNPKGILEIRYEKGQCQFNYFESLQSMREAQGNQFCSQPTNPHMPVRCQHFRHIRRSRGQ